LEDELVAQQTTVEGSGDIEPGASGTVAHGTAAHLEHNPGRPISWVGTSIAIIGFVIGGIAFPISNPAPNWPVFWVGTAVALVGLFILLFSKAMSTDWY
jgi:lipoprotein signal peptidase